MTPFSVTECSEGMLILKSDDSEENSASCQKMQISKLQTVKKGLQASKVKMKKLIQSDFKAKSCNIKKH